MYVLTHKHMYNLYDSGKLFYTIKWSAMKIYKQTYICICMYLCIYLNTNTHFYILYVIFERIDHKIEFDS